MLQVIHKPGSTPIDYLDWREVPSDEQEPRLQVLLKSEREAGFDLLNQPPFHLRLIRVDEARYWFMMSNHHILIDALVPFAVDERLLRPLHRAGRRA